MSTAELEEAHVEATKLMRRMEKAIDGENTLVVCAASVMMLSMAVTTHAKCNGEDREITLSTVIRALTSPQGTIQ